VTRQYRLKLGEPSDAGCYLQGVNEATHGIADSLLSVLGNRAAAITEDIIAGRSGTAPVKVNGTHRPEADHLTPVPIPAEGAART